MAEKCHKKLTFLSVTGSWWSLGKFSMNKKKIVIEMEKKVQW